jgi:hypothetical protein
LRGNPPEAAYLGRTSSVHAKGLAKTVAVGESRDCNVLDFPRLRAGYADPPLSAGFVCLGSGLPASRMMRTRKCCLMAQRSARLALSAGLDVLRALLKRFYCHRDGTCFPSYDAIAEAAGCVRSTVAKKLRILEQLGIIQTIRRKVVASFTSRVHRVRFDVAVQTPNSYRFNIPVMDRPRHGDLGLPLLKPRPEAESELQSETSNQILDTLPPDLRAALQGLRQCIEERDLGR